MQLDESLIGREYPPIRVAVERDRITDFARAIGDLSPCYVGGDPGAVSELDEVVAPPTFAVTLRDEKLYTEGFWNDLGVDVSRVLHGEQELELLQPIRPGRTYSSRFRIADVFRKDSRSGPLAFVVREVTITDATGTIVAMLRHTNVVRLEHP